MTIDIVLAVMVGGIMLAVVLGGILLILDIANKERDYEDEHKHKERSKDLGCWCSDHTKRVCRCCKTDAERQAAAFDDRERQLRLREGRDE